MRYQIKSTTNYNLYLRYPLIPIYGEKNRGFYNDGPSNKNTIIPSLLAARYCLKLANRFQEKFQYKIVPI